MLLAILRPASSFTQDLRPVLDFMRALKQFISSLSNRSAFQRFSIRIWTVFMHSVSLGSAISGWGRVIIGRPVGMLIKAGC